MHRLLRALALCLLLTVPAFAQTGGALIDDGIAAINYDIASIRAVLDGMAAVNSELEARVGALEDATPTPGGIVALSVCPDQRSICVGGDRRFLMGDTAWRAPHEMTFAEWQDYLAARKAQGFDFTMIVAVDGEVGAIRPNSSGLAPLVGGDFRKPDPAFWAEIDRWIKAAAAYGLYVAVVPEWSGSFYPDDPASTATNRFTKATAKTFCAAVAQVIGHNRNLIWLLGGDHGPTKTVTLSDGTKKELDYRGIIDLCIDGIRGEGAAGLIGYHVWGNTATCYKLSGSRVDIHGTQTGHPSKPPWDPDYVTGCWDSGAATRDPKPTADWEPWYFGVRLAAGHWNPDDVKADARIVRREAYWSIIGFGAALHVFGDNAVWQVCRGPSTNAQDEAGCSLGETRDWRAVLSTGVEMRHVKAFAEAVGPLVPDSGLLTSNVTDFAHIVAARGDGVIAAYTYDGGNPIRLRLGSLGPRLSGWWFNPRDGSKRAIAAFANPGTKTFTAPDANDWALVVTNE